jgi:hypothetical protein
MTDQPEPKPSSALTPSESTHPSLPNTTIVKGSGRNYIIGGAGGFLPSATPPDSGAETPNSPDQDGPS